MSPQAAIWLPISGPFEGSSNWTSLATTSSAMCTALPVSHPWSFASGTGATLRTSSASVLSDGLRTAILSTPKRLLTDTFLATIHAVTTTQPEEMRSAGVAALDADPREVILEVRNLRTSFATESGYVPAVDNVSFNVRKGEAVALVGESGCGKSVTAMSIMRLITPPGKI